MAVAVVQEWREEETDRSTTIYDAINERLAEQESPEGMIIHTAGFFGQGFRIFDVWESQEQFQRFMKERLMPIMSEIPGAAGRPPDVSIYELHSYLRP